MSFMIAIGHFAQPSVIELQARVIRATCGDVPILVSDDHSETAFDESKGTGPERGQSIKGKLVEVCKRERLTLVDTAEVRIGHAGGDLGAFYHGLRYAKDHGIDYVWKLSQRFVIDLPNWLEKSVRQMQKFGSRLACAPCFYGQRIHFALRTECVGMRVEDWTRPDFLEDIKPRRLNYAAERLVETIYSRLGAGEAFLNPSWLSQNRLERVPGVAWKDALSKEETLADYARIAERYGVRLGDDFNAEWSCHQPGYLVG